MSLEQREITGTRKRNNIDVHCSDTGLENEDKIKDKKTKIGEARQSVTRRCFCWNQPKCSQVPLHIRKPMSVIRKQIHMRQCQSHKGNSLFLSIPRQCIKEKEINTLAIRGQSC